MAGERDGVEAIAERVRAAAAGGTPLRIAGAGTWLGAGRPVTATDSLSLTEHRGIVEYVPGDLTLTARAGTPLVEIASATAANGQWLPLDPWGGDAGTLGATVSTGTAGPHAFAMGLPRDVVLGVEVVMGNGDVVRAGGRVVKNVAGFDLTRLLVGSWGTLGVITEVTVRLRARPEHTQTLAIAVVNEALALSELALRLRALPFYPLASELLSASLAGHLGLGADPILLCRIGGNEKAVKGQADLLRNIGVPVPASEDLWPRLRTAGADMPASWRWSQLPARFGETWERAAGAAAGLASFVHGNPARGVVRTMAGGDGARLAQSAGSFDGTVSIESLPRDAWDGVRSDSGDSVSRAIRAKFDPRGILNTGILGAAQ